MAHWFLNKTGKLFSEWICAIIDKNQAEKLQKEKQEQFMKEFEQAQRELNTARNNYNSITEPSLLEYYIYEIKAAETRLNYYLKLAKDDHMSNECYIRGMFTRGERGGEVT